MGILPVLLYTLRKSKAAVASRTKEMHPRIDKIIACLNLILLEVYKKREPFLAGFASHVRQGV